jgi:aspartate carbamoyltransferase catalytic subunit
MKHFVDISRLSKQSLTALLAVAEEMVPLARDGTDLAAGKILATLFYEPSTRTRLSFESAMQRLGGRALGFADAAASSVAKGESLADTIRTVDKYADVIAVRHPAEGAALACSFYAEVPIINAGDGGHLHPTQTLLDLLTIKREFGRLENLSVVLTGDLRYGRTASSLALALAPFKPRLVCVAPEGLEFPPHVVRRLRAELGTPVEETEDLAAAARGADVLYVTRIQQERFFSTDDYAKVKGSYVVDKRIVELMPEGSLVLHPLPRVDEIPPAVDDDARARYFEQMRYGVPARMALIAALLGLTDKKIPYKEIRGEELELPCPNPRCVTASEKYLKKLYTPILDKTASLFGELGEGKRYRCLYCDYEVVV